MTDPLARLVIWHFKYRNCRSLAGPLATLMARRWIRSGDREWFSGNPLLVPVPLHPKRLAERGYNQAELLARELARIAALEVSANALVRVRHTASQVETASRDERQENMRDAFTCAKPELVAGRDIVLIDDVSTTGATLDACTGALHLARASTITALVLARG